MNGDAKRLDQTFALDVLERIDAVCLDFEAAWKTGQRPQPERFLGETSGMERSALLRELLLLDVDYRRRCGESPQSADYHLRLPEDAEIIAAVFCTSSAPTDVQTATFHEARTNRVPKKQIQELGDYEVLNVLGRGGMGVVYRARQRSANRIVALKVIHPERLTAALPEHREEALQRFRTEAQAIARLEHDHIVALYEVSETDGQPYFSMRYIEGQSLDQVLRDGPLEALAAAALLEPVASAIHFAHEHGILHRDLKPRNILLDAHRRPYVADFGLAKPLEATQQLTQTGELIGTPAYMSPEQARGASVGPPSDIYSLGATLYEALTGRPPFRAANVAETLRQVLDNEPVPPRRLNPALPRDLETICLKCLEKEPARRYSTAAEVADELRRFSQGIPISARPLTRLTRAWRWCRRNRRVAALSFVAACLLLFLAVAGPIVAVTQADLRQEADNEAAHANELVQEKSTLLDERTELLNEKSILLGETEKQRTRAVAGEKAAKQETAKAMEATAAAQDAERETRRTLYAADMSRVQQYFDAANLSVVRTLLERHRPKPGQEDLRSFEWFYWWRQCHRDLATLNQGVEAERLAVSPQGNLLAVAVAGGKIHLWDVQTHRIQRTLDTGTRTVIALAFCDGGEVLAAAGDKSQIFTWDTTTWKQMAEHRTTFGPCDTSAVCFSDKSQAFAAQMAMAGQIAVWDTSAGERRELENALPGLHIRTPGPTDRMFRGSDGGYATEPTRRAGEKASPSKTWFVGQPDAPPAREHGGPVFGLAISPDRVAVAAGGRTGRVQIWDLATDKVKWFADGHTGIVWSVAFSPNGRTLASAGKDGRIVFWDAQTGERQRSIEAHATEIRSLVYLPGGRTLVSASADTTIKLWDVATGNSKSVLKGHEGPVNAVTCLPDGRTLASASADGTVKLWDTEAQEPRLQTTGYYTFHHVAMSPDQKWLAAFTVEADLHLWDMNTGKRKVLYCPHRMFTYCSLEFSSDGKYLAATSHDDQIRLWRLPGDEEPMTLGGHGKPISALRFSPNSNILVSADTGGAVKLWDVPQQRLQQTLDLQGREVASAVFSPDGATLAMGIRSFDTDRKTWKTGAVELWAVVNGTKKAVLEVPEVTSIVVAWSPNGSRLAAAFSVPSKEQTNQPKQGERQRLSATVQWWDLASGKVEYSRPAGPYTPVALAFSMDGASIVSGHWSYEEQKHVSHAETRVWNIGDGIERPTLPLADYSVKVLCLAFSADARTVAVASPGEDIKLWDVATGKLKSSVGIPSGPVFGLDISPDGKTLALATETAPVSHEAAAAGESMRGPRMTRRLVKLRNLVSGAEQTSLVHLLPYELPTSLAFSRDGKYLVEALSVQEVCARKWLSLGKTGLPVSVAISPDSKTVAVASLEGPISLCNAVDGGTWAILHKDGKCSVDVAFSPDGATLAAATDNSVCLWDVSSRKLKAVLEGHQGIVRSVTYSRDGRTLASASADGTVKLWDTITNNVRLTLRGHAGAVTSLRISPDGRTIASGGSDATIKLWDVKGGEEKGTLQGHTGRVNALAFSPDGRLLASGSEDGTVRLWLGTTDAELQQTLEYKPRLRGSEQPQTLQNEEDR